jgi:GH25 family lysozyme M1 (1,4-beta-N-acetylmuramidase)
MVKGIDVSRHQGKIDWQAVKKSGVQGVIIQMSYGWTHVDSQALYNIQEALKNGLKVGVYHFIYAYSDKQVLDNACLFYDTCKPYLNQITLGCWADWEYDSDDWAAKNGHALNKSERTRFVKLFCEKCRAQGMKGVGIYANLDYLKNKFNDISEYPLWFAYYSSSHTRPEGIKCVIWQDSDKGHVNGISGNVDTDEFYSSPTVYTKPTTVTHRVIRFGMSGEDVAEMQRALISKGYSCGKTGADGKYGNMTKEALGNYQRDHVECGSVDFICGPKTWASLLS